MQDMPDLTPEITAVLLAAAVALWAYFAFVLGPTLWKSDRRAFYLCLGVGIVYGWLLTRFLASGWLGKPENATTVEVLAASAQAMFAVALIVLTVQTVRANAEIANETKSMAVETAMMAVETEKMAEAAVAQQRSATRSILAFQIGPHESWPSPKVARAEMFYIQATNVGLGPALDVRASVIGPPLRYFVDVAPAQPLVIAAGDYQTFTFHLDIDAPFLGTDPMHWPETEADAERAQTILSIKPTGPFTRLTHAQQEELKQLEKEQHSARFKFACRLARRVAKLETAGYVRFVYRDVSYNTHVSTARLIVLPRDDEPQAKDGDDEELPHTPEWPYIRLDSLRVESTTE
jgi:hypothetical protein